MQTDMTISLCIVFMHIMQRMHKNRIAYHRVISTVHTPQMELCCLAANLKSQCLKFSVFWYAVLCLWSSGSWWCEGSQCHLLLGLSDPGDEGAVSCVTSAATSTLTQCIHSNSVVMTANITSQTVCEFLKYYRILLFCNVWSFICHRPGTVAANMARITLSQEEVAKMTYWHGAVTHTRMVPTNSKPCWCTNHIASHQTWTLRSHFRGHIHYLGSSNITEDRNQGRPYVQNILWHPQIRVMVGCCDLHWYVY